MIVLMLDSTVFIGILFLLAKIHSAKVEEEKLRARRPSKPRAKAEGSGAGADTFSGNYIIF